MSRRVVAFAIVTSLVGLVLACFGDALYRDRQFAYRDAAHFYYPLYERVQAEWAAGRWPLWEPEENSGMPLLGNPTAAVLYPGKILYAALPYPWAARLYIVAHSVLAFASMYVLCRHWAMSATGAGLAALGYAFGMPVLFQYCNVIFLVGAAWLPLGFRGADRWLRLGSRWGLLELALVLALQTMGGDPQAAYILGLASAGYAVALCRPAGPRLRLGGWPLAVGLVVVGVLWVAVTLGLAIWLPGFRAPRPPGKPPLALPWMRWVPLAVACIWGLGGLWFLARWRRLSGRSRLGAMLAGLIAAAGLAAGLAAVQLLPVLEFTAQSGRAAGQGPHDLFPFSLEPVRFVELLWPNLFGSHFRGNTGWLAVLAPYGGRAEVWIPSLYVGALNLMLALAALGVRRGPPWRDWLLAIAVVSLLASFGEYTGPLWWARRIPALVPFLGPTDPYMTTTVRLDGALRDGDGSFYWLLATVLPGFRQFRYPSKLVTFTAFGLTALAGLGWDELIAAERRTGRRLRRLVSAVLAVSLLAWLATLALHRPIAEALRQSSLQHGSVFGPFDIAGAIGEFRRGLLQTSAVLVVLLALARWGPRTVPLAGAVAIVVCAIDLGLANSRAVLTVPQALLETTPRVVGLLAEAERQSPAPGPYRVHRMPLWEPLGWKLHPSPDRIRDFIVWERDTIQPKYGIRYGVQYSEALGVAELYDYVWFFGGFLRTIEPAAAALLGISPGEKVVVYPRRAFDLWNTRYFVLPRYPGNWTDEQRGYASFLPGTDPVYPLVEKHPDAQAKQRQREAIEREDFQILRNRDAYPRAWVVHSLRLLTPITGLERTDRDALMEEILYANDYLWHDPHQQVYDPHVMAWVELEPRRQPELYPFLPGMRPGREEKVTVVSYTPQHVELDVVLEHPGLVILADVYYPGWQLTIDGVDAPIYRTNRMMRGAAVPKGPHRLVYTYRPRSFAIGGAITLGALAMLGGLCLLFSVRPGSAVSRFAEPGGAASPLLPRDSEVVD